MSQDVTIERKLFNPFPGLRPFETDEAHLYFGRDGQSDEIIRRLARTRFVGVVGTSGSGKSSLVRAGLLPALHGGFMTTAGSSWRIAVFRPGNNPIRNLATALIRPDVFGSREQDEHIATTVLEATLRRSALGLAEATRLAGMASDEQLLVVVDQFEELFRFKKDSKDLAAQDEAAAFVKLLLEAIHKADLPIYVALTMRSDYLGDCAQFRDLPEALNDGQYLIPRMTRDQRREAIEGPVAVGGGEIAPRLVQRLLNDVGDDPDQLPILQHALMRTWDHWQKNRQGETVIDLVDYEAIGGLSEALSRHADQAYNLLPDNRSKKVAERLFKCLTEKTSDNREIRRPTTFRQICTVVEAGPQEVVQIVDRFRTEGHWFLVPPVDEPLVQDSLIDISHESLIRKWTRLRVWVQEEAESRDRYLDLVRAATAYQRGEKGPWRDPELKLTLQWWESLKPNLAWAQFYHPQFDAAAKFLKLSKEQRDAEALRRHRIFYGSLILLSGLIFVVSWLVVSLYKAAELSRLSTQAERQAAIAAAREKEAVELTRIAQLSAKEALEQKLLAEQNAMKAQKLKVIAEQQAKVAQEQRMIAEQKAKEVLEQRVKVKEKEIEVQQQRRTLDVLFAEVQPSVVRIGALGKAPTLATGFFVSSDGFIITTGHVAKAFSLSSDVPVKTSKSTLSAKIVQINEELDLALLKAAIEDPVSYLTLSNTPVQVGSPVIALGMGARNEWIQTSGTVTEVNASITFSGFSPQPQLGRNLIRVTMQIEGGFSGAPVVDSTKQVIGIVAYGRNDGGDNYLISVSRIKDAFGSELAKP
jgi:S1-C subfamily serine protease